MVAVPIAVWTEPLPATLAGVTVADAVNVGVPTTPDPVMMPVADVETSVGAWVAPVPETSVAVLVAAPVAVWTEPLPVTTVGVTVADAVSVGACT